MKIRSPLVRTAYNVAPMLLWMLLIYSFSTDVASGSRTGGLVERIVRHLFPSLASPALIDQINTVIRKGGHVTEYAILAILAYRAVSSANFFFYHRHVVLPFLICVLYAVSDEYHQSFTTTRDASAVDVLWDTLGVVIGLVLCLWHRALQEARGEEAMMKCRCIPSDG